MKKKHCVLIVEDSPNNRLLFRRMFERDAYDVVEANSAAAALEQLAVIEPDVIMLDLGLPDRDGLEIIPILVAQTSAALIVVSGRNSSEEKVCALDLGADDFITKPFDVSEVLARVRTAIRHRIRAHGAQSSVVAGDVEIDLINRRIVKNGLEIHMTPKEYAVIAELAKYQGRVITHEQLLKSVWENDYEHHIEYLRVVIRSIRAKIETTGNSTSIILNERGIGYRLSSGRGEALCMDR